VITVWTDDCRILDGKNIIIVLLSIILFGLLLLVFFMYFLLARQNQVVYRVVTFILLVLTFVICIFVLTAIVSICLVHSGKGELFGAGKVVLKAVDMLLYPVLGLGRLLGIEKEKVQRAYANLNNKVIYSSKLNLRPQEVLLLLPHCIQNSDCKYRITGNVDNCRRCGKCPVSEIIDLRNKYNIKMAVVPGGTLARKSIRDLKPKAVIAVACEGDLCSGIHDARLIPVVGILNERPQGPCFNTQVDVKKIENAVNFLCNRRDL
jgi:hypothetical protein